MPKTVLKPKTANQRQIGGSHYKGATVEHWDFVHMHGIPYMEAQIIKYVMRWPRKAVLMILEKQTLPAKVERTK